MATTTFDLKIFEMPKEKQETADYTVAIITGKKKISKLAVYRNRSERRIKAAIRATFPSHAINGCSYLFFANPAAVTVPWSTMIHDMETALERYKQKRQKYQQGPTRWNRSNNGDAPKNHQRKNYNFNQSK